MEKFINDIVANLQTYYDSFVAVLPKLILAFLVFAVLLFIANRTRSVVNTRLTTRMDDPLLARFLGTVAKTAIVIVALLLALQIIGLGGLATGLLSGAGVGAFVIGFAFKDIGENFLAGILMAFDRPFNVGDTVELGGEKGKVVALNLRNTQIKSFDGKDIFIPNANIVKNPVTNYTIDGFLRYDFNIGLDYGSDVSEATKIILETLKDVRGILQEQKPPSVSLGSLDSSTFTLTAYYWLDTYDPEISAGGIKTQAVDKVLTNLEKAGFYMPGDIIEMKPYKGVEAVKKAE
jgi:small-conductance mechanosensitive channel